MSELYRSAAGREAILAAYRAQGRRVPFAFESRFVPTRWGSTHVAVAGPQDAPALVALSGVDFGAFFLMEWLQAAARYFRLYVVDVVGQPNLSAETQPAHRGHGYGHWLLDVLQALELGPARMLGVSFGGAIVLDLAALAPERIIRTGLLVPAGLVAPKPLNLVRKLFLPWNLYRFFPRPARLPRLVSPLADNLPEHWYAFFDLLFRHVRWAILPPGPFGANQLAGYTAPTLAIFARNDCFFPADKASVAATERLSGPITTAVIPDKHLPAPSEVSAIEAKLLTFLDAS